MIMRPQRTILFIVLPLLFVFAGLQTVSAQEAASPVSVSVRGESVSYILEMLRSRYGYSFIFKSDNVDTSRKVSLSFKDVGIETVLKDIFDGTDVAYELKDKIIYLSRKEEKALEKK